MTDWSTRHARYMGAQAEEGDVLAMPMPEQRVLTKDEAERVEAVTKAILAPARPGMYSYTITAGGPVSYSAPYAPARTMSQVNMSNVISTTGWITASVGWQNK